LHKVSCEDNGEFCADARKLLILEDDTDALMRPGLAL
jgi:hypothetical protein